MLNQYQQWIELNVPESCRGDCAKITLQMKKEFPELQRVRGHYCCDMGGGRRQHWWLKTPDGIIVDPTANQFPSQGHGDYEEWKEGNPEPTGRCLYCGDYCYDNNVVCSRSCDAALMAEY